MNKPNTQPAIPKKSGTRFVGACDCGEVRMRSCGSRAMLACPCQPVRVITGSGISTLVDAEKAHGDHDNKR